MEEAAAEAAEMVARSIQKALGPLQMAAIHILGADRIVIDMIDDEEVSGIAVSFYREKKAGN